MPNIKSQKKKKNLAFRNVIDCLEEALLVYN